MLSSRTTRILLRLTLVMAAGAASGCAPSAPPPSAVPSATAMLPTATSTKVTVATAMPTYTPFVPKGTVKIVSQSPESTDIWPAAQLAVTKLSDPLRAIGYEVEFRGYDDENDVDVALENAAAIIADEDILCGVGHYLSVVTLNTTEKYHLAGLAFISPSSTNPKVTDRHYPEVSRVGGRDDAVASAAVRFAEDKNVETAYVVSINHDYFHRVAGAFREEAGKSGLEIVGNGQSGGMNEALTTKIVEVNPDMVFFSGFSADAGKFFRQVRQAGYQGILFAIDGAPGLGQEAGFQATDGGGTYYLSAGAPVDVYAETEQFVRDFNAAFHAAPQPYAAEAYDAAGICLKAIEEAIKAKGGDLPTRAEVVQAVREITDYQGITGSFTFNPDGDPVLSNYFVMQLTNIDNASWKKNPIAGVYAVPPPE